MTKSTAKRGRPRSEAARVAILAAAYAELAECGYAAFALSSVAARAQVGKTTIYRWWSDHAALAVDAFFAATETALRFPDTGSAREDFRRQVLQLGRLLRSADGAVFVAMVIGATREPVLGRALSSRWVEPRKRWGLDRLRRAVAQGECRPDIDCEAALDLLYGPLYARLLLGLGVPREAYLRRILALALDAVFVPARGD